MVHSQFGSPLLISSGKTALSYTSRASTKSFPANLNVDPFTPKSFAPRKHVESFDEVRAEINFDRGCLH